MEITSEGDEYCNAWSVLAAGPCLCSRCFCIHAPKEKRRDPIWYPLVTPGFIDEQFTYIMNISYFAYIGERSYIWVKIYPINLSLIFSLLNRNFLSQNILLSIAKCTDTMIWIQIFRCIFVFTGREIFVGLSGRTNLLGAQAVAKAFPEYPTTIVQVRETAEQRDI